MYITVQEVLVDDAKLSPVGERVSPLSCQWTRCVGATNDAWRHKAMNLVNQLCISTGTG